MSLDYETGKILADDVRQLRKENSDLIRSQPEKVWQWLADILGVEAVQRNSALPSDFPEDGPFAVRMSGIDKTATDEDIKAYFEEREVEVKCVEQFEVPRHTARIDFHDRSALEKAIQLSGHNLLRRKVKVELWSEGTTSGITSSPGAKPLKPYTGPLPDEPPFKVIIRGLDKSVTRSDIGYFFWDRDCQVADIDFPLKSERHAGIVEFENQESLRNAMGLNSAIFKGREVSIALPSKEDLRPSATARGGGGGSGSGGGRGRGASSTGRGGGYSSTDRDRGVDAGPSREFRLDRQPPSRAEFGSDRPRLELKPRSRPMPGEPGYREEQTRPGNPSKPDPFGGAVPREDRFKSTRADADENWRR